MSFQGVHLLQHPSAPDEQRVRLQAQVEAGQALLPRLQHPAYHMIYTTTYIILYL